MSDGKQADKSRLLSSAHGFKQHSLTDGVQASKIDKSQLRKVYTSIPYRFYTKHNRKADT